MNESGNNIRTFENKEDILLRFIQNNIIKSYYNFQITEIFQINI